jgi:isopentenyl diphosphate isomerase/L-lactate dehydrogenase-like FMN-dependent dehydrogenase
MRPLNVYEYRKLARRRLPRGLFDFVDRGCEDEVAIAANLEAFRDIKLRPRVLADVSRRERRPNSSDRNSRLR